MWNFKTWAMLSHILLALIAAACDAIAGTPHEKAVAAVSVAHAMVQVADDRPALPDQGPKYSSMGMTFHKVAVSSEVMPAQLVIEGWESGCPHCVRQERDIVRILGKLGWSIGNLPSDQIQFVHVPQTVTAPQSVLYQNGIEIRRWEGYQDVAMLSNELRKAWDNSPSPNDHIASAGPAGAIQAKAQISQTIAWFREYVGEGVPVQFRWDRSGAQSFPLLAKGDWSAQALFGKYGHIEVSAAGAKNLPIQSLGFGYKIVGEDVQLDLDTVTLQGLALKLGPANSQSVGAEPVPSQFALTSIMTILWVIRDLWLMAHPSMDLQLGGNVTATAMLNGDTLGIDFQEAPSIKLIALFTFNLGVKRIEIVLDKSVRVLFTGSRLVKERTFSIE